METCKENVSTDSWHRRDCGKPVIETIGVKKLCKMHAKRLRIRLGMETDEVLETRYYVSREGGPPCITEVKGALGKKQFTVRKRKTLFGEDSIYGDTNIPNDHSKLFIELEKAKTCALDWSNEIKKETLEELAELDKLISELS